MGGSRKRRNKSKQQNNTNINTQEIETINKSLKLTASIQVKEKIEFLQNYYKKYNNADKIHKLKEVELQAEKQEYKIAVVANMTAGKSTFINALFGEEILPAYTYATTDCATYIYSKPDIEKKAIIHFSDDKKSIEIKEDLAQEINQYAQKDEECEDEKYKNVEHIEFFYPFKYLQTTQNEDIAIAFIDTPGPNSTGEGYKQKHKDQTRKVLNEVDLALFMFDFVQIDANLKSDEQGLWNTIKKRYKEDKNFEVSFLLNKIDEAFSDNFKDIKAKDEKEYKKYKLENWYKGEKEAIEKLRKAAKEHEIREPKIYPISSFYQLLHRKDRNWGEKKDYRNFTEDYFQELFEDEWENKLIEYLGIEQMEQDINTYIKSNVKDKILLKISSALNSIINEEKQFLKQKIELLEKPKEEAEQNLQKAILFLENKADDMEKEFRDKSIKIQKKYINSIRKIIDDNIEKELNGNIDEATNRTIKFLELLLEQYREADALASAKNLPNKKIKNHLDKGHIEITVARKFEVESVEKSLGNFIRSILNDYKNNYLDMKIDIKNNYLKLSKDVIALFDDHKQEFNKELKETLKVENIDFDESSLYSEGVFDADIKVPQSTIDYKYQSSQWSKGGSFSSRKKIRNEKHSIIISPQKIKKIFQLSINSMKHSYYNQEVETYENTIVDFIKFYQDKFNDFKQLKQQEIEGIKKDLDNSKEELEKISLQYEELKKIYGER